MIESAQHVVIATLKEMGLHAAEGTLHSTFALSEGRLVAEKIFFEGGYAVWVTGRGTVSFYDEGGGLLRSVGVGAGGREKAA